MKIYPDVNSFIGGLLTPKLEGKVDYAKYGVGCRILENFIVTPTGGIYKRPGTHFVAKAKTNNVRLIPFDFNGTESQSYVLEIGSGYIRFFSRQGQVVNASNQPLELLIPQLTDMDLTRLNYTQSADVIYFAHPYMQPWRLERLSATSWAYQPMTFLQGTGAESLPFSATNYPSKVRIYEDRLVYAATPRQPLNIWMSRLANYDDFRLNTNLQNSDRTMEPLPEDSIWLRVTGSRVNPIMWLLDMEQLVVGTNASEIRVQGRDIDSPLTPQTTGHKRQSSYGSNYVQAIMLGSSAMFVSRSGNDVYTLDYQDFGYRFKSAPLNLLAPEATKPGVVEMHSMGEPEPIAWCILADGTFSGCTYIRDQQIFAWHRHSTQGKVRSGAIVPYAKGDQLWLAVERGNETFIEFMEHPFDYTADNAVDSVFMDSLLMGTVSQEGRILGLSYLAGQDVQVISNGSYLGLLPVDSQGAVYDSKIELGAKVVAGLQYVAEVQPMRPNYGIPSKARGGGGAGQSVHFKKRVVDVVLRVLGSIKGEVRAEYEQPVPGLSPGEFGQWQELIAFPHGTIGSIPPPCRTETITVPVSGNSSRDGLVRVRQADPFPMFITAIAYGIDQPQGA